MIDRLFGDLFFFNMMILILLFWNVLLNLGIGKNIIYFIVIICIIVYEIMV